MQQHLYVRRLIITTLTLISLSTVWSCSMESDTTSEPSADPQQRLAEEHAQFALTQTERILETARQESTKPREFGSDDDCWQLFREQSQHNTTAYTLTIVTNAQDTPYPFRDVMDVRVGVHFPDGQEAILWWYAEGLGACIPYETGIPRN